MYKRKEIRINVLISVLSVLAVCFISVSLTALLLTRYYARQQFQTIGSICNGILEAQPDTRRTLAEVLKDHKENAELLKDHKEDAEGANVRREDADIPPEGNILASFGFSPADFWNPSYIILFTGIGFAAGTGLFLLSNWYCRKKERLRLKSLTDYLRKVNSGGQGLLLETADNDYSRLQDELYKTVTQLYQTREEALKAKKNFADNLFNIAHQLKTPITAISLSNQMIMEHTSSIYPRQIEQQLNRLTRFEETLLLLSRFDAGTLSLERKKVDLFTVLTLAADHLQELFRQAEVSIDIQETGEAEITADLEWTMEAFINLFKNCMEHTPKGKTVHCSYEQNPLYAQIVIWDEGPGFDKDDIPHLFERFYRGKNAKDGGIGIGLPLAKTIIEMQNGVISAGNTPDSHARFEIRIYRH